MRRSEPRPPGLSRALLGWSAERLGAPELVSVVALGGGNRIGLFLTAASVLLLVGVIACGVPVRRALRIQPVEALRDAG